MLASEFSCISGFVLVADESDKEENAREVGKEECELEVVCLWMEVRGVPDLVEEEAQGLLCEVFLFACHCIAF